MTAGRRSLDLTDYSAVHAFFAANRPDYVVLAAGKVGGIVENQTHPADFMTQNLAIQLNVFAAAHQNGVKKLVFFGSSCMYPRECSQPMPETHLLTGKPEPTSAAYAISKLAGLQMCLAYNKQYDGTRFIPLIPNSVYGPHDNFDPKTSHVLSALIHRLHQAKISKKETVELWGTGSPRREFIHADDVADACLFLLTHDPVNIDLPLNIGVGIDYSIRELAEAIALIVGYTGRLEWDTTKPDGAPRKLLDSSKIYALGWKPSIPLEKGLKDTYAWYLAHAPIAVG